MNRKFPLFFCVLAFLVLPSAASAGDVLDRIVAVVNGHIILQSDWDDAHRYEAFVDGHPLNQVRTEDRKAVLDQLDRPGIAA